MASDCPILHVDMDAFFASVEQRDDSSLRGRPVLVGFDGPRGVVAAASYEARTFGCHSAQPMAAAKRLCPHAAIVPVRHAHYRAVSHQVFEIFDRFSPVVESVSIDEAFLDLRGTERLLGEPHQVARQIKQCITAAVGLTASIGIAPNKFLAKLASDMNKPKGLTVIGPDDIDTVLPPLPVTRLWGIGRVTGAKLNARGIHTVAHLRAMPADAMERHFGSSAGRYAELARGIDDRPVTPDRDAKSIGHEQTFELNLTDPGQVLAVLAVQVEAVCQRLRRGGLVAGGVSLKIRYGGFQTISRSATLPHSTSSTAELWEAAQRLFRAWPFEPVRLIGVCAQRLSRGPTQLPLFVDPQQQKHQKLDAIADRINDRFGKRSIRRLVVD
jgi:DNA polymerase-4